MLFRHAEADRPDNVADHERPLSVRGLEQARLMGEHIKANSLVPDLAIVSSARRTQETWSAASSEAGFSPRKVDEPRIYESTAGNLLEVLREQDAAHARIMMVGHNPGMERLAAWLLNSGDAAALARLQREFVVGGLAVLDFQVTSWKELDVRSGHLARFDTPESV